MYSVTPTQITGTYQVRNSPAILQKNRSIYSILNPFLWAMLGSRDVPFASLFVDGGISFNHWGVFAMLHLS